MNYNEFGHLDKEPQEAALGYQIGPKLVITFRPADSSCPAAGSTRSAGWPGPAGAPFVPWRYPPMAGGSGTAPRSRGLHNAWRTPGLAISGIGTETRPRFFRAAPTRSGRSNRRESRSPSPGTFLLSEITECLG